MTGEAITQAYEKFIETEERRQTAAPRQWVYASSWSACTRQMALDMLRPDVKPPFQADTLANFRRGNDRARDLKADFTRIGRYCEPAFDVVGAEERFELRDKKGRVVIVGKVDFRLKFVGVRGSAPVETKSFHPNLTQGVRTFADMFGNRWTRKGAFQLLAYLLATNEPVGFMLLDRPGLPRILEVRLFDWLPQIEDFLQRAEVALDARERVAILDERGPSVRDMAEYGETTREAVISDLLPDFIDDPSECRVCPFFAVACNPPISYDGAAILTDEATLAQIEKHEALDEPRTEYKDTHDELAETLKRMVPKTFKGKNRKQIIAGKYMVSAGWSKKSTLDLPADVEKSLEQYRKTEDDGKFGFSIVKVSE